VQALTNLQKQMPEVLSWRDSLEKVQASSRDLCPQNGSTSAGRAVSEERDADAQQQKCSDAATESPVTPDSQPASGLQETEDTDSKAEVNALEAPAATFVPRVKFRLDLKGPSGVEVVRPACRNASQDQSQDLNPSKAPELPPAPPPPPLPIPASPTCHAEVLESKELLAGSSAHTSSNGAVAGALEEAAKMSVHAADFVESSLSLSQDSDDRLMPLGTGVASGVATAASATAAAIAAAVKGAIPPTGLETSSSSVEPTSKHPHQLGLSQAIKVSTSHEGGTQPAPRRSRWDLGAADNPGTVLRAATPLRPDCLTGPVSLGERQVLCTDSSQQKRTRSPANGEEGRNLYRKLSRQWLPSPVGTTQIGSTAHALDADDGRDGRRYSLLESPLSGKASKVSLNKASDSMAGVRDVTDKSHAPATLAWMGNKASSSGRVQAPAARRKIGKEQMVAASNRVPAPEMEAKSMTILPAPAEATRTPRHLAEIEEEPVTPPSAEPPPLPPLGSVAALFDVEMSPVTSEDAADARQSVPAPPQVPVPIAARAGRGSSTLEAQLVHELEEEPLTPPESASKAIYYDQLPSHICLAYGILAGLVHKCGEGLGKADMAGLHCSGCQP
jgi:hypothetical protein